MTYNNLGQSGPVLARVVLTLRPKSIGILSIAEKRGAEHETEKLVEQHMDWTDGLMPYGRAGIGAVGGG
jgi:hypothetical protein